MGKSTGVRKSILIMKFLELKPSLQYSSTPLSQREFAEDL